MTNPLQIQSPSTLSRNPPYINQHTLGQSCAPSLMDLGLGTPTTQEPKPSPQLTGGSSAPKQERQDQESPISPNSLATRQEPCTQFNRRSSQLTYHCQVLCFQDSASYERVQALELAVYPTPSPSVTSQPLPGTKPVSSTPSVNVGRGGKEVR